MNPNTRSIAVDRDRPDPAALERAAAILRAGGLVAFPTETVYGLGADATDPAAVARIFEAKGRPATNPLIVHADGPGMARACVSAWPDRADRLARRFWPGPLTLILPRSASIPDAVTAGRETVAVRVPDHPVARGLIERVGRPLAAPSANRSTGLSPTRAEHVRKDLAGRVDLILDAGLTDFGLESTVLDLAADPPRLLRPGVLSAEELGDVLGLAIEGPPVAPADPNRPMSSPGQSAVHYAPRTPTFRYEAEEAGAIPHRGDRAALLVLGHPDLVLPRLRPIERHDLSEPGEAARSLYATLHRWDELGFDRIEIVMPPDTPAWSAIRDRLRRAASPPPVRGG